MINVFKKVLMTTACVLFITTVSAQDKSAEESNAPVNETSVAAESAVDPAALSAELSSQKFLLTYKLNGRVYYQRSVAFGTVIQTIDAPVKEGFVLRPAYVAFPSFVLLMLSSPLCWPSLKLPRSSSLLKGSKKVGKR